MWSEQVADCLCGQVKAVVKLKKELDAAPEDKKGEIMDKVLNLKQPACIDELEAKMKAYPQADQAKLETDIKAAMEKKCGDDLKTMGS